MDFNEVIMNERKMNRRRVIVKCKTWSDIKSSLRTEFFNLLLKKISLCACIFCICTCVLVSSTEIYRKGSFVGPYGMKFVIRFNMK